MTHNRSRRPPEPIIDSIGARACRIYGKHGDQPAAVSLFLRALRVCNVTEARLVSGLVYDISEESEVAISMLIALPENIVVRVIPWIYSEDATRLTVYEDPTLNDPGEPMPLISRNRVNIVPPKVVATRWPDWSDAGTLVFKAIIPPACVELVQRELILAPGKSYLIVGEQLMGKDPFLVQIAVLPRGEDALEEIRHQIGDA